MAQSFARHKGRLLCFPGCRELELWPARPCLPTWWISLRRCFLLWSQWKAFDNPVGFPLVKPDHRNVCKFDGIGFALQDCFHWAVFGASDFCETTTEISVGVLKRLPCGLSNPEGVFRLGLG